MKIFSPNGKNWGSIFPTNERKQRMTGDKKTPIHAERSYANIGAAMEVHSQLGFGWTANLNRGFLANFGRTSLDLRLVAQ